MNMHSKPQASWRGQSLPAPGRSWFLISRNRKEVSLEAWDPRVGPWGITFKKLVLTSCQRWAGWTCRLIQSFGSFAPYEG